MGMDVYGKKYLARLDRLYKKYGVERHIFLPSDVQEKVRMEMDARPGAYFRASLWTWAPIVELIADTGIFSEERLGLLSGNCGDDAEVTAEEASLLADRLDTSTGIVLEAGDMLVHPSKKEVLENGAVVETREFCPGKQKCSLPDTYHESPYSVEREDLLEFVEFCRASGGFVVY